MIRIELFTRNDFGRLISWITDEESLVQFAGTIFSYPLTTDQLKKYLVEADRFAFKVIEMPERNVIGHAEIFRTNQLNAFICRILIGDPLLRGKGYGHQLMTELLTYAFIKLQMSRIELNVYDWNSSAIKCYEKSGFSINPELKRSVVVNGKTWRSVNMILEKNNWINLAE